MNATEANKKAQDYLNSDLDTLEKQEFSLIMNDIEEAANMGKFAIVRMYDVNFNEHLVVTERMLHKLRELEYSVDFAGEGNTKVLTIDW